MRCRPRGNVRFSHIDYVFTTVPLNVKLPVPVREADFFLETSDVNAIRKVLSDDTAQSGLRELFL